MEGGVEARDLREVWLHLTHGCNSSEIVRQMQWRKRDELLEAFFNFWCHKDRAVAVCTTVNNAVADCEKRPPIALVLDGFNQKIERCSVIRQRRLLFKQVLTFRIVGMETTARETDPLN